MEKTKRCCDCKADKPLDCFYRNARKQDGHGNRCKPCSAVYMRLYYHRRKAGTVARTYPKPDLVDEQAFFSFFGPRWRQKATNLRPYGLSLYDYMALWLLQDGKCRLCGTYSDARQELRKRKLFDIDHCHQTGEVRSLLCHQCNLLLAGVENNLPWFEAAVLYLKKREE